MHANRAFSLVELSIVLVILGLLVGGILVGQSMIRASELRAALGELNKYLTSTQAFRDKYMGRPGDITNATAFWGQAGGNGANGVCNNAVNGSSQATCNGDGNGYVNWVASINETGLFWQHLINAGLMEGKVTSIQTIGVIGGDMPYSRIAGASWFSGGDNAAVSGSAQNFDGMYPNTFIFMIRPAPSTRYGVMTPEETWNLDTKMDDGAVTTGKFMSTWGTFFSQSGTACTTATSGADFTGTYNLPNKNKDCVIVYKNAY